MYRILNPMNHNVALVRNEKGEELVIVGKESFLVKRRVILSQKKRLRKSFG